MVPRMKTMTNALPARLALFAPLFLTALLAAPDPVRSALAQKGAENPTRADRKATRAEEKKDFAALPAQYKEWLEEVDAIISTAERSAFLALDKDYQRDAFIAKFWESRDPYRSTARNELRDQWDQRVALIKERYNGNFKAERARILLRNGAPTVVFEVRCTTVAWPLEIWYYQGSDTTKYEFFVVFYQKWGAGDYRIWQPVDGIPALFVDGNQNASLQQLANSCRNGDKVAGAISWVARQGMGYATILASFDRKPEGPNGEWVASFGSYSTDIPPDAATFPVKIDLQYPGRYQSRTVLQGIASVPASEVTEAKLAEHRSYNLLLNGEVIDKGKLFDRFRYKFDFTPADIHDGQLPLVFQRHLRPGDYLLVLRLEDINSGKLAREERRITVPATDVSVPPPPPSDADTARLLEEANKRLLTGDVTLKIVRPPGDLKAGLVRFDTLVTGAGIDRVTFALDGKAVLTKRKPPYSVELDLGGLPRTRTLTAIAYDAAGENMTSDEMLINSSGHRFTVRLLEPQRYKRYTSSLMAQAEPVVPEGQALERVEFYLNETPVATLYQPPYVQPIVLPKDQGLSYVRSVAYLTDGNATEDLVFINAPDIEEVNVQFVELYTTVLDRAGRPVDGLEQKNFSVVEDGVKQTIARFDKVTDLPIHAAVALDISASMTDSIDEARNAALEFFQQTIKPKDRAAFIPFNDRPALAVKFTNDVNSLAGGLAGLKAERGTSLWDSIVFCLYYFNGIKGQRALLLLSDGKDEGSRFTWDDALEYARRAGVTIYTIGLGGDIEKKKLSKLAEETGGRSFFVETAAELKPIYAAIEKELRSQYLIAYQSTNAGGETAFRTIDLKVDQSGLEAKTLRGYYP
jgi:VWFA-related protein